MADSGNNISNDPAKKSNGRGGIPVPFVQWMTRICFAIVFIWNVECALSFMVDPAANMGAYQLSGIEGEVAVRGMGVAFLMWNVTYPLFIWQPSRFKVLGWVIVIQQVIGLVGELFIASTIPAGNMVLTNAIARFVGFDAVGLVLMALSFALLLGKSRPALQK